MSLSAAPASLKDAIDLLVKVYGASVRVPVSYSTSSDTPDALDAAYPGIRVSVDMRTRFFPRRVQEARLAAGMPSHPNIVDHVTFDPEPSRG